MHYGVTVDMSCHIQYKLTNNGITFKKIPYNIYDSVIKRASHMNKSSKITFMMNSS